jgi:hypothetical protein
MTVVLQSCQPYSLSQTNEHAEFLHIKKVVWLSFMKTKPINIVKLIQIKHQEKLQHNAAKKIVLFFFPYTKCDLCFHFSVHRLLLKIFF